MTRQFRVTLYLLIFVCTALPFHLNAEPQQEADRLTREISLELFSPFCPGRSLEDCPSDKAHALKEEIRTEILKGKEKKEIIDLLVQKYGNELKAVPDAAGFGLLAWAIPIAFLSIGFLLIFTLVKRSGNKDGQLKGNQPSK